MSAPQLQLALERAEIDPTLGRPHLRDVVRRDGGAGVGQ
jgi:hypothetical protein